jgi:hypothetical protein
MTETKQSTRVDRAQEEREELARIAREAREMKLDEITAGKSPVYLVDGNEVGPNGRPLKDGRELPPGPGEMS